MNIRLSKEFRPLLLPWAVAAIAAATTPFRLLALDLQKPGEFWEMLLNLVPFAFFGGIVALGASSFGVEFQHRTLSLMLTQPVQRERLWSEKMRALATAGVMVVLIYCMSWLGLSVLVRWLGQQAVSLTAEQAVLVGIFLVATLCSAGFWTLQARSVIGGMTFCIGSQIAVALGVDAVVEKISRGRAGGLEDWPVTLTLAITGLMYSAIFLWLGRRKFAVWQLKDVSFGEGPIFTPAVATKWRLGWLRCRPERPWLNLIRKELRLQKPLLQVAAMLSAAWVAVLILLVLQPSRKDLYATILNVITVIWIPLLALLAGCASLGEEKTLGVAEWQLTLPVSARRQWSVKLCVSAVAGAVLGVALPLSLAIVTLAKSKVGLAYVLKDGVGPGLPSAVIMVFVIGFWAGTLFSATIRAALNTVLTVVTLCIAAGLGAWAGHLFGGLEAPLLLYLMIHFQLPPNYFEAVFFNSGDSIIAFFAVPICVVALGQSFRLFRRAQAGKRLIWKYFLILILFGFCIAFWGADLAVSSGPAFSSRLQAEVVEAVKSLPSSNIPVSTPRTITLQELEQTGKLSRTTKMWLKDSSISVIKVLFKNGTNSVPGLTVSVRFAGGETMGFNSQSGIFSVLQPHPRNNQ